VRTNKADVNNPLWAINPDHQPILIASDTKDNGTVALKVPNAETRAVMLEVHDLLRNRRARLEDQN
jgi:hypothetical protein